MFKKVLCLLCLPFISFAANDQIQERGEAAVTPRSLPVSRSSQNIEQLAFTESPSGFHRNLSFVLDYGAAFGNVLAMCPKIAMSTGLSISTGLSGLSMAGSLFSPYYDEGTSKLLKTLDASLSLFIPITNICAVSAEDEENKDRLNNLAFVLTILKAGVSTKIHKQKEARLKNSQKKE